MNSTYLAGGTVMRLVNVMRVPFVLVQIWKLGSEILRVVFNDGLMNV